MQTAQLAGLPKDNVSEVCTLRVCLRTVGPGPVIDFVDFMLKGWRGAEGAVLPSQLRADWLGSTESAAAVSVLQRKPSYMLFNGREKDRVKSHTFLIESISPFTA